MTEGTEHDSIYMDLQSRRTFSESNSLRCPSLGKSQPDQLLLTSRRLSNHYAGAHNSGGSIYAVDKIDEATMDAENDEDPQSDAGGEDIHQLSIIEEEETRARSSYKVVVNTGSQLGSSADSDVFKQNLFFRSEVIGQKTKQFTYDEVVIEERQSSSD